MTEKRFTVPLKYSLSHSKIQCDGKPLTNDELVRILNTNDGAFLENFNLKKENAELRQDNDIKFWKLQCIKYFNTNSLFMSEISRAIKKGYHVSDKFQKYLDELKKDSKEIKEKNKRLFGDD